MTDFALARRNMIDGQLRPNRVTNAQLLAAIGELPRERFLPEAARSVAYADDDVPLGNGRYLMEPMVLARLIQTLQPRPEDRALVVASGRGLRRGAIGTAGAVGRGRRERPCPAGGGRADSEGTGHHRHPTDDRQAGAGRCRIGALRRDPDRRRGPDRARRRSSINWPRAGA